MRIAIRPGRIGGGQGIAQQGEGPGRGVFTGGTPGQLASNKISASTAGGIVDMPHRTLPGAVLDGLHRNRNGHAEAHPGGDVVQDILGMPQAGEERRGIEGVEMVHDHSLGPRQLQTLVCRDTVDQKELLEDVMLQARPLQGTQS